MPPCVQVILDIWHVEVGLQSYISEGPVALGLLEQKGAHPLNSQRALPFDEGLTMPQCPGLGFEDRHIMPGLAGQLIPP